LELVRASAPEVRRGATAIAALLVCALGPSGASAQQPRAVALRWNAPAGCPSQDAVDAELARLLAGARVDTARSVTATATVTLVGEQYRLRLEIERDGSTSAREITGASCLGVANAAALMVAMAIDPEAARAAGPPPAAATGTTTGSAGTTAPGTPSGGTTAAPAAKAAVAPSRAPVPPGAPKPAARVARVTPARTPPAAARPPSTEPPTEASTPPPADARSDQRVQLGFRLFAGAVGDLGTLGVPTAAAEVGGALVVSAFRIDAAVAFWPTRDVTVTDGAGEGGSIDLIAGDLGACWAPPPISRAVAPRFAIDLPCLGAELGRMSAEGFGVDEERQGGGLWLAARGGAAAAVRIESWIALRLRLEAAVPLVRPRFLLGGVGTVHEPGAAGRAALDLELAP